MPILAATAFRQQPPKPGVPPKWSSGYSASTLASSAMFCLARFEQTSNPAYRDLLVAIADAYLGSRPEEDLDAWPMSFAHAISAQVAAYRFTSRPAYLEEARKLARRAVDVFWQDSPLPRASLFAPQLDNRTFHRFNRLDTGA